MPNLRRYPSPNPTPCLGEYKYPQNTPDMGIDKKLSANAMLARYILDTMKRCIGGGANRTTYIDIHRAHFSGKNIRGNHPIGLKRENLSYRIY